MLALCPLWMCDGRLCNAGYSADGRRNGASNVAERAHHNFQLPRGIERTSPRYDVQRPRGFPTRITASSPPQESDSGARCSRLIAQQAVKSNGGQRDRRHNGTSIPITAGRLPSTRSQQSTADDLFTLRDASSQNALKRPRDPSPARVPGFSFIPEPEPHLRASWGTVRTRGREGSSELSRADCRGGQSGWPLSSCGGLRKTTPEMSSCTKRWAGHFFVKLGSRHSATRPRRANQTTTEEKRKRMPSFLEGLEDEEASVVTEAAR